MRSTGSETWGRVNFRGVDFSGHNRRPYKWDLLYTRKMPSRNLWNLSLSGRLQCPLHRPRRHPVPCIVRLTKEWRPILWAAGIRDKGAFFTPILLSLERPYERARKEKTRQKDKGMARDGYGDSCAGLSALSKVRHWSWWHNLYFAPNFKPPWTTKKTQYGRLNMSIDRQFTLHINWHIK